MSNQYNHKAAGSFENKDDDFLPAATSAFGAEAHSHHKADLHNAAESPARVPHPTFNP